MPSYTSSHRPISTRIAGSILASFMAIFPLSPALARPEGEVVVTAAEPEDVLVTRVFYSDLNLQNDAGFARLDARVRSAVRQVCPLVSARDLREALDHRECRRSAFNQANTQIDELRSQQHASRVGSITIASRR
jgi:UrcA family protein